MAALSDNKEAGQYLLHPQAETFGPFDLAFVRQKLSEGAVAPTTGLTILRGGVEDKWHSVGELWPESREWTIACTECKFNHTVTVTEAITIYGRDDYRKEQLEEFVKRRSPKFLSIDECAARYPEGHGVGRPIKYDPPSLDPWWVRLARHLTFSLFRQ